MPLITIKVVEGVLSDSQKQELVKKITDAMVSVEGENTRPYAVVVIEEVKSGDWAIGGKQMSTEEVRAIAAARPRPSPPARGRARQGPRRRAALARGLGRSKVSRR
jgi:4-oxalocrotonate tautomerase